MPTAPTLLAGRYRLGESLGEGGMGRVWLAADEILDRDVAIKEIVLPPELIGKDRTAVRNRTLREARAVARLSHPGVVQVYDVLEADGRTFIVMEYVPSRSLHEVLRADGPLEPSGAAQVGLEMLAALSAAHRAGVLHRDVKPANVLLADDGRVVLSDFGIATVEGDGLTTSSGLMLGSPEYMSPEQVRHGTAGPASDLWSLGATLYAAVEGRSPYHRASVMETVTALAVDEPDPPRRAGALRPVLDGLLRTDPAERIDADEAERRLQRAVTSGEIPRPRTPDPAERIAPAEPPSTEPPSTEPPSTEPPSTEPPSTEPPSTEPPSTEPPSTEPPSAGRRNAMIAVAVVLALALVVTVLVVRSDPDGRPTARAPVTTAPAAPAPGGSAPAGSAPSGSAPAGSAPGGSAPATGPASAAPAGVTPAPNRSARPPLPAGWTDYRDRTGFSVYVPTGWNRSREGTMVYFRDPRTGRVLGIDQTTRPAPDPVADWRGKAGYRVSRGDFPGYDEIHIKAVRYWREAADWEFTFDGGRRQHVNNRGFVVSDRQAYGIWWQTRHADWAAARPDLQLVFDSFRPKR